jgi:hypothetical protein
VAVLSPLSRFSTRGGVGRHGLEAQGNDVRGVAPHFILVNDRTCVNTQHVFCPEESTFMSILLAGKR